MLSQHLNRIGGSHGQLYKIIRTRNIEKKTVKNLKRPGVPVAGQSESLSSAVQRGVKRLKTSVGKSDTGKAVAGAARRSKARPRAKKLGKRQKKGHKKSKKQVVKKRKKGRKVKKRGRKKARGTRKRKTKSQKAAKKRRTRKRKSAPKTVFD